MISIINAGTPAEQQLLERLRKRSDTDSSEIRSIVAGIVKRVREDGDEAVKQYTATLDSPSAEYYEVPREVIDKAREHCSPKFIEAMEKAAKNISEFHKKQLTRSWLETREDGVIVGQRVRGLNRVGVYVPCGTAPLSSSVLMNLIPAKIAGVKEIIMCTPPLKTGQPNMEMLAAAAIGGADRVFLIGGAQAIAAMAYGTRQIPQVDKIVGPGNIYVATAKRLVYGTVDIDMFAGPSEILIIADETANPEFLAADLLSQAEHDRIASAIMLTTSRELAEKTDDCMRRQAAVLPRRDIAARSVEDYGAIVVCDSIDYAIDLANKISPEHLEMCVENPMEYIGRVDNVGSLFLGNYSPESLGDYCAGPNHVLPTSGTARFFSPLSVDSFIKKSSFIYYNKEALRGVCDTITAMAEAEKLDGHANAARVRFEDGE